MDGSNTRAGIKGGILLVLEGLPFSRDRRARSEASALTKDGYRVSVIGPAAPGEPPFETIDGINVYRFPAAPERGGKLGFILEYTHSFLAVARLCWKAYREQGFDIIQAANPPDILFLIARFYKIFLRKTFVFDHRDICPEIYLVRFGKPKGSIMHRLLLWLERCTYNAADVVLTVNRSLRSLAMSRGGKDPSRVFVVRCAPDTTTFRAVDQRPELRCGRNHLVCYAGIMGAQDGVENLLYAIDHVVNDCKREDVFFAVMGSGDQLERLRLLARDLGIEEYTTFPGFIKDDSLLLAYLSTADVCVAPEPYNELNDKCSFVKIAEYLAVGKPVVAFDLIQTRISAQAAAVYATPNDTADFGEKILELIDDPLRRKTMEKRAAERIDEFLSWSHSEKRLLEAYRLAFEIHDKRQGPAEDKQDIRGNMNQSEVRRVCHIVQSYYPRDPRIRRQAEALVEAGIHVDVVCLRNPKESPREVVNGVQVYRVPLSRQRGSSFRYLFEYIAFFCLASFVMAMRLGRRYCVIHVSNMPDFLVFSAALPKLFGSKVLLDEHDPMPELFAAKGGAVANSRFVRLIRWQERISVRFAHQALTVSQAMRRRLAKTAGSVPVAVVMNLPDSRLFESARPRSGEPRDLDRFVLLYAGTVSKQYGLSIAVEVVNALRNQIPELRLRVVGDGDDVPSLRALAAKLGISDRVEFVGDVPFSRIPGLIDESDIGISTLKRDAMTDLFFTNKGAEYVSMGLPAVVARTTAVEDYFPDGIVSMYESDDVESLKRAIVELYERPEMRAARSLKGIEFSRQSNWSTEKGKYVELIRGLCRQDKQDNI